MYIRDPQPEPLALADATAGSVVGTLLVVAAVGFGLMKVLAADDAADRAKARRRAELQRGLGGRQWVGKSYAR